MCGDGNGTRPKVTFDLMSRLSFETIRLTSTRWRSPCYTERQYQSRMRYLHKERVTEEWFYIPTYVFRARVSLRVCTNRTVSFIQIRVNGTAESQTRELIFILPLPTIQSSSRASRSSLSWSSFLSMFETQERKWTIKLYFSFKIISGSYQNFLVNIFGIKISSFNLFKIHIIIS